MRVNIKNISKTYTADKNKINALNEVSLDIEQSDFIAICGVSGSGKSTLLNVIGGLDNVDSGSIFYDDIDANKMTDKENAAFRNKHIGFVFQDYALIPYRSVKENLVIPLMFSNIPSKEYTSAINHVVELIGIKEFINRKVSSLSGGQKQRVAIARSLVCDPDIVLADEPTGALDVESKKMVIELLKKVNELGKTVIVVTHDTDVANSAKRVVKIVDGRIYEET